MQVTAPRIEVDLHEPIVFRTTTSDVYRNTLEHGSLWLRSDQYYRDLEDTARNDESEGVNCGTTSVPLRLQVGGVNLNIAGDGSIGQVIRPHYLLSFHGTSISTRQRHAFGSHTFGVRSFSRLAIEVLYQVSQQIKSDGYRYGQVSYQHAALSVSSFANGAAIGLGGNPPLSLGALNTDVLRKRPILPFIEQDEWRIVVFTAGYRNDDARTPLKINVSLKHFYPYECPSSSE